MMEDKNTPEQFNKIKSSNNSFVKVLFSTICSVVTAVAVIVLICNFVFPVFRVTGSSMEPTLSKGQTVLCYKTSDIKKGDIIAFYHNKKVLIKRVIAVSDDVVNICNDGTVELNGKKLDEPYVSKSDVGESDISFPFTVPDSRYFVMGDERETSVDSRSASVGCVAEENIIGKIYFIVTPFSSMGKIE
ncbi:signal peptidase I [Ruminococcus sp.]|uniref:signal peptidase I n=1 Tax=Ruminococcus sp. TaxID=41978 RepID=UPI0025CC9461|nr:signal peptidase I [Ruminococcus sp.]